MIFPEADKLENWGSRYGLVTLAAKRAKQLKAGAHPLIQTDSKNPLTIALEEIASGAINTVISDNDLPKVDLDSRVSLISSFSFGDDSDEILTLSSTDDEEWDEFEDEDLDEIDDDETSDDEDDADAILAEDIIPVKKKDDEEEDIEIEDVDVDADDISLDDIEEDIEEEEEDI
ncbi:MAG: DNA-directed RNA polymerase subunit omega [Armatimonadota bacterium]